MAGTETAWRCSQCGAINEAGSRACHNCGKWPSLFDLQTSVEDAAPAEEDPLFEPETFEAEVFEPAPYAGVPAAPETFEPDVEPEEGEERRSRFPRWIVSAIWIVGIVVWLIVNALSDRA